jgi:tRNA pseudouridine synthase D (truD)
MDIISHLTSNLPLKREDIGIAGLKDKEGITRQRITIYKKKIKSC